MKKLVFLTGLLFLTSTLFTAPYFSEYHENHFIVVFRGDVAEKDISKIKVLERRYVEEMTTLTRAPMNISEELEKLGVSVEVMTDDSKVLPQKHPILPE